jgi:Cdc6-like AAA superfamily ATPase
VRRLPEITLEEVERLDIEVSRVFRPAAPVDEQALFAGRKNELRQVLDAIQQPGQHVLIFGERGVGKTSLANILATKLTTRSASALVIAPRVNCDTGDDYSSVWRKVFSKIDLLHQKHQPGFINAKTSGEVIKMDESLPKKITTEDVRRQLAALEGNLVLPIIDEFDRIRSTQAKAMFADTIKTLSDHDVKATVVLVGVADTVDVLIEQHHSIGRALAQVRMPRMTPAELKEIVTKGLSHLPMTMADDALTQIAVLSQGLPYYVHLLALCACREALDNLTNEITIDHLESGIGSALRQIQQSLKSAYHKATASPRKKNLYSEVLLACALAETDEQGYFTAARVREPLCRITRTDYDIPSFAKHLKAFSEKDRGEVLQRFGAKHKIRFRFVDPLMQPYAVMRALDSGTLSKSLLHTISLAKLSAAGN